MKIYGDSISGNCLKVKWTADRLGLAYDWIETSVLAGETRTEAFLALNPAGQAPLVPGDAYAITVTATNGLFTSDAATGTLAAYSSTGGGQQPVQTGPIQQPVQTQPAQVSGVKAGTMKSGSKKLKLTLGGVTTVPGKVKVYDGKKLLGTATVKNGKLVLKLKKKLAKGKHKVTVKYAGSSSVAKFTKKTKIKVT